MKKVIFTTILTFILISIYSCQENKKSIDESYIIGHWKIYDLLDNTKNINPQLIEEGKKIALSTEYIFKKDNTYSMTSSIKDANGTWSYDSESRIIKMNYSSEFEENAVEKYEVSEFDDDKMVWRTNYDEFGFFEMMVSKK